MTIGELNQLAYLGKAIELEKERLNALRESVDVKSPIITDMPKAPGARDKLGETVPQIVDREAEILESIRRYEALKKRAEQFINRTPNVRMKMILIMRFMEQKQWQEIAAIIGGKETEYSVKQACYRYVEGREEPDWRKNQISMFDQPGSSQNV